MLEALALPSCTRSRRQPPLDAISAGRRVDIVFSDVMMPGGMNGVDLAREIRRRRPDLPVVLTTGYVEAARTAVTEGLAVLVKPYPLKVLARTLNAQLAGVLPRRISAAFSVGGRRRTERREHHEEGFRVQRLDEMHVGSQFAASCSGFRRFPSRSAPR